MADDAVDFKLVDDRVVINGRELWLERDGTKRPAAFVKSDKDLVWVKMHGGKNARFNVKELAEAPRIGVLRDRASQRFFLRSPGADDAEDDSAMLRQWRRTHQTSKARSKPVVDVEEPVNQWLPPSNTTDAVDYVDTQTPIEPSVSTPPAEDAVDAETRDQDASSHTDAVDDNNAIDTENVVDQLDAVDAETAHQDAVPCTDVVDADTLAPSVQDVADVADVVDADTTQLDEPSHNDVVDALTVPDTIDLDTAVFTEDQLAEMQSLYNRREFANSGIQALESLARTKRDSKLRQKAAKLNWLFFNHPEHFMALLDMVTDLLAAESEAMDAETPQQDTPARSDAVDAETPVRTEATLATTPRPRTPATRASSQLANPTRHSVYINEATDRFLQTRPDFEQRITAYLDSHPKIHHIRSADLLEAVFGLEYYDRTCSVALAAVMRDRGWLKTPIHHKHDRSRTFQGWRKLPI